MNTRPATNPYKRHRFPAEIISHCVWLYFPFCLSYRDVEELMAERGIILTYEAVRYWCLKFGQAYVNQVRHRRPRPGDKWHLDEVFLTINKERHPLSSCCLGWYGYVRTARAMRRNGEPQKGHPRRAACRRQRTDALNMGQWGRVGAS
jgi:hypothetical protein